MAATVTPPSRTNGKPHYYLKLAILGEKQVGKTSLVTRYMQDTFSMTYLHTKGGDMNEKVVKWEKTLVHVRIIDSAGHKYVRSLIKSLYRDVHGIMLVYDVTRHSTFRALEEWMYEISLVNTNNPYILVVGNKADLKSYSKVSAEEANMYALRHEMEHIECSAKSSFNVSSAFEQLLQKTLSSQQPTVPNNNIKLSTERQDAEEKKKQHCCNVSS